MKRVFLKTVLCSTVLGTFGISKNLIAQEKKPYVKVKPITKPMIVDEEKPTLVELFSYGCPHCFKMSPMVDDFAKKYAGKINFVKYPVGFKNWESGTKLYFTLDNFKLLETHHKTLFNEIHVNSKQILNNEKTRNEFFNQIGLNIKDANDYLNSFTLNTKLSQAKKFTEEIELNSSPALLVYYKGEFYLTSPAHAGGYQGAINVVESLLKEIGVNK